MIRRTRLFDAAFYAVTAILALVVARQAYGYLTRQHSITTFAYHVPGDTLPPVRLRTLVGDPDGAVITKPLLPDLAGTICGIVVFFESSCPACDAFAPMWADVDSIHRDGHWLPVSWITVHHDDPGAAAFAQRHSIPLPIYEVPSRTDLAALGVKFWPQVWIVDRWGVLRGHASRTPEEIEISRSCVEGPGIPNRVAP